MMPRIFNHFRKPKQACFKYTQTSVSSGARAIGALLGLPHWSAPVFQELVVGRITFHSTSHRFPANCSCKCSLNYWRGFYRVPERQCFSVCFPVSILISTFDTPLRIFMRTDIYTHMCNEIPLPTVLWKVIFNLHYRHLKHILPRKIPVSFFSTFPHFSGS